MTITREEREQQLLALAATKQGVVELINRLKELKGQGSGSSLPPGTLLVAEILHLEFPD
jgi:hypothetical protein